MGYFSNGNEGMDYEARYCDHCVHNGKCTVWLLHNLHNYKECNNNDSMLHTLIPRSKDGIGNEKCTMFHRGPSPAIEQEREESGLRKRVHPDQKEWAESKGLI